MGKYYLFADKICDNGVALGNKSIVDRLNNLFEDNLNLNAHISKLIKEKQELRNKLKETDKERHEEWLTGKEWKWECDRLKKELHTANQETLHFQNKYFAENQKAIAVLEKVKELIDKRNNGTRNGNHSEKYKDGYSGCSCDVVDIIDQQIKELKGDANENN